MKSTDTATKLQLAKRERGGSVASSRVREKSATFEAISRSRKANSAPKATGKPPRTFVDSDLTLMKSRSGSSRSFYSAAYRSTRDHLLRARWPYYAAIIFIAVGFLLLHLWLG